MSNYPILHPQRVETALFLHALAFWNNGMKSANLPITKCTKSSGILRVLGKKYIKRLLTVNTMYYMKPQNPI